MTNDRLTGSEYWDTGYVNNAQGTPLAPDSFRHLGERRIVNTLEPLLLAGKRVLEIGAGNSAVLTHLARAYAGRCEFFGLDYSETGCRSLAERAKREGAKVAVLCQDMFDPDPALLGKFDVVYSLGVVEHFSSLRDALLAQARLLAPRGRMVTIIPNMAGVLGWLTNRYNPRVYALHNPHDLGSFRRGHSDAGLVIEAAGYLCSNNFGVLSSCFTSEADRGWTVYKWLSRLTVCLWYVEDKVGELPRTGWCSPYIYAVSRAQE